MRKSFIVHKDSLGVLDDLTDEQCGELFRAIKAHQLGESIDLSPIAKVAFSPFKAQFDRDDEKYQNIVDRNKLNGSKGGRPKNPKEPNGLSGNPAKPQKADSDSKSVSKSVKDKTLDQSALDHEFDQAWELYGRKGNKKTSRSRFNKLSREDKESIYNHLPVYLLSTPDKQYRKDFQSYINLECWNDEVAISRPQETPSSGHAKNGSLIERIADRSWAKGIVDGI